MARPKATEGPESRKPFRLTLSFRLRAGIVALVGLVVLLLTLLHVQRVAGMAYESTLYNTRAQVEHVRNMLVHRVAELTTGDPRSIDESARAWSDIIRTDPEIRSTLLRTLANSPAVTEICIYDRERNILASSGGAHSQALTLPAFPEWNDKHTGDRLDLLARRASYSVELPVGVGSERMFTIQAIVSSVLIGNLVMPHVIEVALVGVMALLIALITAVLFSNIVTRPLLRISGMLDTLTAGDTGAAGAPPFQSPELAELHSKLNLLGERYRGATKDAFDLRTDIETMLDRLEDIVLLFGADGRLAYASRSAEQITGHPFRTAAQQRYGDVLAAAGEVGQTIRTIVDARQNVRDLRVVANTADGERAYLLNADELRVGSERRAMLIRLRDAATRDELQNQLDTATRLAAINRLTGGVAHEIKNPLNAMTLHVELLKTRISDDDAEAMNIVNIIGNEVRRLERVVKTFLDFTRPVELKLRLLDFSATIGECAALLAADAASRNMTISTDLPNGLRMNADEGLLRQAVLNVMKNGLEAMQPGGELRVRAARQGSMLVLEIQDQGKGIDSTAGEQIFNLYFTTKPEGSGIGLALTFRVVQLHGGKISYESTLGQGTTFRLEFPSSS